MKQAAGVMLSDADGRVLMMRRRGHDHPGCWAFPGGGIETDETAEQAARRELQEETGFALTDPLTPLTRRQKDDVDFTTFFGTVKEQFPVQLNDEHDMFGWFPRSDLLAPHPSVSLHPGVMIALKRADMDELEVAKAIRDGELTSPQHFGNIMLVDMRVTGTGVSYRPTHKEYVYRDKSLYLNDHFLERSAGLPIIVEHPDNGKPLDTEQFRDRIAGTVLLPYIRGEEVWGIGKIYDMAVAELLLTKKLSTSPCVVFKPGDGNQKMTAEDGKSVLIEGKPFLLDHLAICYEGVWDKGGEPTGVENDSSQSEARGDSVVEAAPETVQPDGLTDKKEGEALDKVLSHLDSIHTRLDEVCSRMDSFGGRMDAFEKKGEPAAEKEEVKEEVKESAPPAAEKEAGEESKEVEKKAVTEEAEATPMVSDTKHDGEDQPGTETEGKALTEEREENGLSKNDSRADSTEMTALRAEVAELRGRVPDAISEKDRLEFVDAQSKAERVAQVFGDSAGAPARVNGESLLQYRRRLVGKYLKHSPAWKDADLSKCDATVLGVIETQVYADAIKAASSPDFAEAGTLRSIVSQDDTGRRITRFVGDPEACWGPFKLQPRTVAGMNFFKN